MHEQYEMTFETTPQQTTTPAQGSINTTGPKQTCKGNCLGCVLHKEHHLIKDNQGLIELARRENQR